MVDKNKNGIDDKYEKYKPGQKTAAGKRAGVNPYVGLFENVPGLNNIVPGGLVQAGRQGLNFLSSAADEFSGFMGNQNRPSEKDRIGAGWGDQLLGVQGGKNGLYNDRNRSVQAAALAKLKDQPVAEGPGQPEAPVTQRKGLLDYLAEAGGIIDQLGLGGAVGGGIQAVDYSPEMEAARGRAASNRGHLGAVYNQLREGLEADRGGITQNYGGAIDRSQEIAQQAQETTRSAWDAAQSRQDQSAAALGMESAAAAQQLDRPTSQQRAADAISDSAAYAENAQQQYNSQQANALTHNTNVTGASRFSEARAQGDLDLSLEDRLAGLARLQSEANAQAQAQNAQLAGAGASERGSSILSLAQSLYGDSNDQSQQDFENQLAAAKLQGQQAPPGYTLEQLMKGQQQSGLNTQDYTTFMKLLASLND